MAKYIIIGGGLAGLSSAVYLTEEGHKVELIEASPKLGGRTYSFHIEKNETEIDNGQHLLMGSYKATFDFLKIIGSEKLPDYSKSLNVNFVKRGGIDYSLNSRNFIYPVNLLYALFNFGVLSLKEKLSVIKLLFALYRGNAKHIINKNAEEWLILNGQSNNTIRVLWDIIGIGALNTRLNEASAELFSSIIYKMFFTGKNSATFVLPNVPLNKLFVDPTINFFNLRGIKYSLSEKLIKLIYSDKTVNKIYTNKREIVSFDYLVLALPPYSIGKIKANSVILDNNILSMETSPIITIHMWYGGEFFNGKFIALIDSKIHWIFKNKNHLSIVISAADDHMNLNKDEITIMVRNALSDYFPRFEADKMFDLQVIKEKRATLKSSNENERIRQIIKSDSSNLIFAGDWTNTNLPGTIEGAILSGKIASKIKNI